MTNPTVRRFDAVWLPLADAISALDIGQVDREKVAAAVTTAITYGQASGHHRDFMPELFGQLAADPSTPCQGYEFEGEHVDCPKRVVFRIAMHSRDTPDHRSAEWAERPPGRRCAACGAIQFMGLTPSALYPVGPV